MSDELRGRVVLVTGASGLMGSWLVRALLARGAEVVVIRREKPAVPGRREPGLSSDAAVEVVAGDVCTEGLVERALARCGADTVFHLAAQTIVGVAREAPRRTFETNIRGTWLVLEACRRVGVERVIVASSDKAYGSQEQLPYREDQSLAPINPYDVSKAACDLLARSYWPSFGLGVAVTRFANLYGGGDLNRSRLVPEVVGAALAGVAPVIRSDGSSERDFLYVEDAVEAYLAIWRLLGRGEGRGEAFNAGGGAPVRVRDVVTLACRLAGGPMPPTFQGAGVPAGEIDRQWVDYSKLHALTGWRPRIGLEEGLARTIAWYRANQLLLERAATD